MAGIQDRARHLMNTLKADSTNNSGSLVLSFEAKWEQLLADGQVSVVFRKKGPLRTDLDYLYIYASLPVSALIGRAAIVNYTVADTHDALRLAGKGAISERDLRGYIGHSPTVGVFTIGKFEPAKHRLTTSDLGQRFGFKPPQRFFFLSKDGKARLDAATGFRR